MEDNVEIGAGVTPDLGGRKLATIRTIAELSPIEGADKIEAARVDGWWCVVSKGEFKVGDPCVYFEIDSFIPVGEKHPHFEFLRKRAIKWEGKEGCRLRTIRLKGQVSQGLAMPLSSFQFIMDLNLDGENTPLLIDFLELNGRGVFEGNNDVTDLLKIEKWEAPIPAQLGGKAKGNFPSGIPKTDQERVQNMGRELARLRRLDEEADEYNMNREQFAVAKPNIKLEATTKLDGSSMTVYLTKELEFGVCSRNFDLVRDENNSFWAYVIREGVEEKLRKYAADLERFFPGIAIQGELIGPGIQGNQEKLTQTEFAVFDIWFMGPAGSADPVYNVASYARPVDRHRLCDYLGLKQVPFLGYYCLSEFVTIDDFKAFAKGPSWNPEVKREGVVFKVIDQPHISWKCIDEEWLLANE